MDFPDTPGALGKPGKMGLPGELGELGELGGLGKPGEREMLSLYDAVGSRAMCRGMRARVINYGFTSGRRDSRSRIPNPSASRDASTQIDELVATSPASRESTGVRWSRMREARL